MDMQSLINEKQKKINKLIQEIDIISNNSAVCYMLKKGDDETLNENRFGIFIDLDLLYPVTQSDLNNLKNDLYQTFSKQKP